MSVEEILRRQAGVISRRQAVAEGVSGSTVADKVAAGLWRMLHPGVYLASTHNLTSDASVHAAMLWAGTGAVLSGRAAAWWHGLLVEHPSAVDITVPRRRYPRPQPKIRVRRRDLDRVDVIQRRGLLVTAVPLTVLEAAVALGPQRGAKLLDRALQRTVSFDAVHQAHCRNLSRHGSVSAGQLLATTADRAGSHAERIMTKLLRDERLTGWRRGYRIDDYEADFAFSAERVAVEVDGWAWHTDVVRFRHDRQRQNALVLAGWTILRFTWHDLTQRPAAVMIEIRAALTAARRGEHARSVIS